MKRLSKLAVSIGLLCGIISTEGTKAVTGDGTINKSSIKHALHQ